MVPLECNSRPETPKILVITPEFVSKNCFFADFAIKTLFLWFHPRIREISRIFRTKIFFLVFTPEFVEFRKDLCFLVHSLEFEVLKFLCILPQIGLCPLVTLSWRWACVMLARYCKFLKYVMLKF